MNHIYKSIFNKALGVFTAVPEFASAHGKGSERTVVGRVAKGTAGFAASALAISIGLALSSNAMANVDTDVASGVLRIADPTGTNSIRMGSGTTLDDANKQWNSISIGTDAGVNTASSVAIGYGAKAGKADKSLGQGAVALGYNAQALGTSGIAIGEESSTTNGHNGVAIGAYTKTENEKSISIGAFSTASGAQSIVMSSNYDTNSRGPVSVASGRRSQIYGSETTVSGEQSVSIGDTNTIASARTYALGNNINVAAGADDSLVFGTRANVGGESSIAIGKSAKATKNWASAIGTDAIASGGSGSQAYGYDSVASGKSAIAQGFHSHADGQSAIAIGDNAKAGGIATVSVGYMANGQSADVDKANTPSTNKATYGTAVGHFAGADYVGTDNLRSTALGNQAGRYGEGGIVNTAVGNLAGMYVKGSQNVAVGNLAGSGDATNKLEANNTVSIGTASKASANNATAMGTQAAASGANSYAIGLNAKATTDSSLAIGTAAEAGGPAANATLLGTKAIAIGYETKALGTSNVALGYGSVAENGHDSIAIGIKTKTSNLKSISIGAYSEASGAQSTVISNNYGSATAVSTASGTRSQVYGAETNVSGDNSVAIGDTNTVASARTYVMGNNINAAAGTNDSLAFGTKAGVGGANAIALGNTAKATQDNSIAQGTESATYGKQSVSIGYKAVSGLTAPTASQTNAFSVSIGNETEALDASTVAIGDKAKAKGGVDALAVGTQANAMTYKALAIGAYSQATGRQSTVIGNDIQGQPSIASGTRSQIIGVQSNVSGDNSVSIGDTNTIASARTYAIGNNINVAAGADDSLAFGTRAAVGAANTVAIGANANAAQANSVALGAGSATSAPHTGAYTLNGSYTAAGLPNAANGTVSVGSAGKERQIQNVAAGVISATSTDAINGSQLYATNNYMNNFAGDVKTKLGGNAALGNDGHLTMTNIGGTGKDNVNDAIAAANTKVAAGDNITVTPTTNADGSKTYTVATKKDLIVDSVKAGDTTVNTNGVTIANGPSVTKTGINAGDKKITGVANGNVAAGSTDAVNGGQLAEVKAKADSAVQNVVSANPTALTATKAGDTVTLTPNFIAGDLVNPATGAVNTPAAGDAGKLVTAGTVAKALAETHFVVDTKATTGGELDGASQADQKIKSGNKVTLQAGKNLKAKQTNGTDGAQVEFSLKDSISLTQVTAGTGDNQVVLGNNGVQVGGNTYINKDGLNANNKPISNVADGVKPKDAVNKGQLDAVAQEAAKHTTVKAGQNVEVTEANNAAGGKEYTVKTADNLNVTSVKAGDSTLNTDGVTITGGPSVKKDGINAGDKKITNVAPGTVAAGSKDAVNGGQLAEVKAKADSAVQNVVSTNPTALTATKAGDTVTLTPNFIAGDLVNADGTVKDPAAADEGKLVSAKTVADALKVNHFVVDTKANGGKVETGSEADAKVGSGNKVTFEAGKNLVAKQANTANGGATVKFSLQDDISLNSVTAGTGDNQVVLGNDGVKVGGNTYINNDGLNANDKKITNVAPGAVTPTSKDAVNGGQLYDVAKNVADLVGPDAKIDPATGKVSVADPAQGIGGTGKDNIGDAIKAVNATAAKHTTVVEGKNVKVTKGKNAAGGDEYTVATKDDLDVTSVTAGNTTVNTNGLTITGGPSVTRGGIDAGNRIISGVKAGDVSATSQEAVNGSQLHATNTKLDGVKAKADTAVQDVKSGDENALTAVKDPNTNIVTVTPKLSGDLVDADGNITAPATPADKGKLVTAGTVAQALANTHFVVDTKATDGELDGASQADQKIKAGNKVTLQAGKNLKAKQTNGANGAEVEFSLKDSISLTQVTAGDSTLNTDGLTIAGGPSVKKDGIDAGDKKITNVAPGAVTPTSKDAVNGSQLYNVANNVKDLIGPDATIDPATGKVTVADPAKGIGETGKGTIGEAIKSVKDKADTAVQDIKSGDEKALSVTKAGNTYTITPNLSGDLVDADGNITAPATDADKGKLVTAGTVAQALANTHFVVDTKATDGELDGASQADQKIKAGNKVTLQAGKNLKAKQTNGANGAQVEFSLKDSISLKEVTAGEGDNQVVLGNDGVKVGGNTYINKDGLNANSKVISNVADGVKPTDAVNKGQLDAVGKEAAKHTTVKAGKNVEVTEGTNAAGGKEYTVKTADNLDVTSVKAGDSTLNTDGLTIAGGPSVKKDGINAGDKKITNVAPGAVTPTSKDAVNGSQLYNVANNVKDLIGPDAAIDPATGKVTVADPAKGIGETGKGNIGDAIKHVNDAAKAAADTAKKHTTVEQGDNIVVEESTNANGGKHYKVSTAKDLNVDSVKAGDTTVNNDGVTIAGGPSVTKGGINAGGNTITNVADGVNPNDAVNKGQLDKVAQNVVNVLGGNATVNGNGDITMSNIGDTGKGNVNDAIKAVNDLAKKAAAEKTSVKAKDGRSNVTVTEGVNAAGGHEYTVDVERAVTEAGSDQVTVTSKHDADSNTTTYTVDVSDKTKASLAKADSAVQGLTSKDGNLNFNKDPNGNVEVSFNDNLNVKNVTTDRVQVANGPSMSKDGINAAGKAISNVANGNVAADSKDAVNGGQLYDTAKSVADVIGGGATVKDGKVVAGQNGIGNTGQNTVHGAIAAINQNTVNNFNQIRGDLRKMDRDLRGGIAGALATAGLPQAFRPGKSMVAAAASTYRGQSGLAIGVSRISDNGKVILKVTGNTNSRGDFGGTIGAGYQW